MKPNPVRRIPCHLIAGPLGVGKTTAILNYLKHSDNGEHIAVVVNDYGSSGLDSVILGDEARKARGGLVVIPVPGGCLCCTSAIHFESHLRKLAKTPGIDRIIIEPSGIVLLDQMKSLLLKQAESLPLDIRPVMVLVNVARFNERLFTDMPYYSILASEADILVGNRCDLASDIQVERFNAFAHSLGPPSKQVFTTSHGHLPPEAFAARGTLSRSFTRGSPDRLHLARRITGSIQWAPEVQFECSRLMAVLTEWNERSADPDNRRLKAIMSTNRGWQLIEIAQGGLHVRPFPGQSINRVDWIAARAADHAILSEALSLAITRIRNNESHATTGFQPTDR